MNLGQILTRMYARADWGPTASTQLKERAVAFINDALNIMAEEAPYAFVQERLMFTTDPDVSPFAATDTITLTEQWVFQRDTLEAAIPAGQSWPLAPTMLTTDVRYRTWDGRLLLVKDYQDRWRRYHIRDFWSDQVNQYVSVYEPTQSGFAIMPTPNWSELEWRIVTREHWLPDDIISIDSVQLYHEGRTWWVDFDDQEYAEERFYDDDSSDNACGIPNEVYRRGHWQIDAPTQAPTVSLAKLDNWAGPWPAGTFDFYETYCWGLRSWLERTPGNFGEPLWESSPSPVSSTATTTNAGVAILYSSPDIHFEQGYGDAGDDRYHHAGWWKRIYVRRTDTDTTPGGGVADVSVAETNAWFLLDEIEGYEGVIGNEYVFDGENIPDYHRRLRQVNGYMGIGLYPRPDDVYQVDLRCIRRPRKLEDDSDAPPIHTDAVTALVARALAYFYENQGNAAMRAASLQEYERALLTLSKRYGDLRPASRPIRRDYARALATRSQHYRKWY